MCTTRLGYPYFMKEAKRLGMVQNTDKNHTATKDGVKFKS
jgi:hypothetical protein